MFSGVLPGTSLRIYPQPGASTHCPGWSKSPRPLSERVESPRTRLLRKHGFHHHVPSQLNRGGGIVPFARQPKSSSGIAGGILAEHFQEYFLENRNTSVHYYPTPKNVWLRKQRPTEIKHRRTPQQFQSDANKAGPVTKEVNCWWRRCVRTAKTKFSDLDKTRQEPARRS